MNTKKLPQKVSIVEVGPRDGLQNEPEFLASTDKINFINELSTTGLQRIEVTSFVSVKAIPQLADHEYVFANINKSFNVCFSVLVPNEQGMITALKGGVKSIAVFTAASETFNQKNIHCSIAESITRFKIILKLAQENNIFTRAYISCVMGCPYEGKIQPQKVAQLAQELLEMGINEISLGDTIGVGTPKQTNELLDEVLKFVPIEKLAMHLHDTYGQALTNIYTSLLRGIKCFDSSIAGLGGCPYAFGASGNVATEDVLYLMNGLGIETGVDIYKIVHIGDKLCKKLGRENHSKVAKALLPNCKS